MFWPLLVVFDVQGAPTLTRPTSDSQGPWDGPDEEDEEYGWGETVWWWFSAVWVVNKFRYVFRGQFLIVCTDYVLYVANHGAQRAQEALKRQAVLATLQFKKIKKPDAIGGTTMVDPPVLALNSCAVSVAADLNSETPITMEVQNMDVDGAPSLAIGGDTQASVSSSSFGM